MVFAEADAGQNLLELRRQKLSGGGRHTVRVVQDSYVYTFDHNEEGQLDLDYWTDVVKDVAGIYNMIVLHSDCTIYATGLNWKV